MATLVSTGKQTGIPELRAIEYTGDRYVGWGAFLRRILVRIDYLR